MAGIVPKLELDRPDPSLVNDDIRPVALADRHWSVLAMASLWVGMVVCVPTYMLAGGLIDQGMSWGQAVLTVMLGNLVVLVPMILNGHPGTKYGVPFPVLARASFGVFGAHVPSLARALVACGWFGIQTWVGGAAVFQLIDVMASADLAALADLPVLGINAVELACFLGFWALQVVIIHRGVESIRLLESAAAPFLIAMGLALLVWAYVKADGFGPMLSAPSQFDAGGPREGEFWSVFFPSLTAMVGFWATLSLNIPDFTRYAKSQRDQVLGQAIGLPATMTLFAFISVAVTSATTVIFGEAVWDPTVLLGKMGGGVSVVLSLLALTVATLSTNIAANVVSPANAMINVNPRKISFRLGGYVTAGLGVVIFPWKLLESTDGYIFTWLVGYSALLGPIGGILITDYFLVRRTRLDLEGLYRLDGPYRYKGGFNPAALIALVVAVLPNVPGFIHAAGFVDAVAPIWDQLYSYAWFVGFLVGGGLYWVLMRAQPLADQADQGGQREESETT
ncbi:NCS1 family nucleobase:cation symporter-1 [Pseudenhygromyxa sp. WMMC2535]|uniref:NCS1 family nucleobase:cation symporter-1 n=1 Tax=Pseudenhygromyxa sp. WMMC2535 TaxID=2712867 RepID=UPI00155359D5|nr:NCS1 family nucleobase:cation symporter-1 [Pseudenhygromyxa sp. WMMC2535]NVB42073.1 NCS1 family nucleobase:cation symporter-1 [Pseudenhygromyxa sp. WMMC2535]